MILDQIKTMRVRKFKKSIYRRGFGREEQTGG